MLRRKRKDVMKEETEGKRKKKREGKIFSTGKGKARKKERKREGI